ncbi:PREDICTED: 24-methylenesterol C-methyltransferase 2-like [Populus euphratica]|uniref:24-methylenesterol C-methyltransferase 2-like n=1 Tax=Populus euphratica TaxID=75702 RepID=A0AAJ6X299_POPEU|nr:PREDICTED: 24-methylenesterol C-methyltransferase 2-like [Populus euphratica]
MDALALFCTGALIAGGIYWFVCILGPAEQKGKRAVDLSGGSISAEKVQDNYKQYWSFFRRPKEIETAEKVPDFVDTFYNLVTDIYEWGWGQSFHFSPSIPGKSHLEATRLHEEMAVDLINVKPGDRILDVGCGVGGPMRAIAAHSRAKVVGITINDYQVNRARMHNKKAGLDSLCEVVQGNFLEMPFPRNHIVVTILSALGIAPKGTVDVHEMLFKTADYLTKGGDTGIFTPMHMILCRKPEKKTEETSNS